MGATLAISKSSLYSRTVPRALHRSPTFGLFLGLIITLAAVAAYSWYIAVQISRLRELQTNLADQYRRDSLQLLRIQNDLNSLGLAMRDMLANDEPYPLTAWSAQFQRVHDDLDDALRLEGQFASVQRTPDQKKYLLTSFAQFWNAVDHAFSLAREGNDAAVLEQIHVSLQARQASLSTAVARQLVENNEGEEQAALQIGGIYDRVQRRLYWFLAAILAAILLTSLYLIRSNRLLFAQIAALSNQRSELAQKLIATQESTLRYISRELHDEFGQVLTAIGSLLSRSERQIPESSSLRSDLHEVRDITEHALQTVRTLSQSLHPVMLNGRPRKYDRLVSFDRRETNRRGRNVREKRHGSPAQQRRHCEYLPNLAGSVEQRHAALWSKSGVGAFEIHRKRFGTRSRRQRQWTCHTIKKPRHRFGCDARARGTLEWLYRICSTCEGWNAGAAARACRGG